MIDLDFLVFIHLESRRIGGSRCTAGPSGEWTTQQARNFQMHLQDEGLPCEILQRDQRDTLTHSMKCFGRLAA
jgi:putative transposase